MSAALADLVAASIAGQAAADRAIERVVGGCDHPDALHVALLDVWAKHGSSGLLGAHRAVQKRLERVVR